MSLTDKEIQWLHDKSATPEEIKIYGIMKGLYDGKPLMNGDIASVHGTHRTNIGAHMKRMILKGIVSRYRHQYYVPNKP